ncbi:MAG: DnaK suppressor protein, putative [Cytophagales bacterium]|jgi:RNA polymerase-binding transcription factor DksA|nr:MAG: DnaK suppressor protein, putative [Cytophagales bacterium]
MAKSAKKKSSKPAKKSSAKPKKAAKVKKTVAKKPSKKIAPKKVAKKTSPKKVAAKKIAKKTIPTKPAKAQAHIVNKPAPAQLNIFSIPTQRPIAHKPVKSSSVPDTKTRYSDEELKEFEMLINGKLDKAREEFKILKETLNRNNDEGTDSTSGGNTKVLEDGAETAEKENMSQLAARQLKYITNLENALVRIKNGTYGICSVTGKLISKERLIAVPHTTQSIEAKMMKQD